MKQLLTIIIATGLSFGALAQSNGDVIVSSGDIEITRGEFEAALANLPQEYKMYASGEGRKAFAKDFLRMKVLANVAEKEHLAEDPEIRAQLELMRANLLANAQLEKMSERVEVEDEALQKAYDEKKSQLERASARHILIAFEGSRAAGENALSDEAAKAKAEKIRTDLLAGAEFAELAKESDDKTSGARGGDLGTFGRGQMVPPFDQAVFAAKSGELLPVVRTQYGYHVIEVTDRSLTPFDEIKPQLERELTQKIVEEKIEALEGDIATSATYDPSFFGDSEATDEKASNRSK